jgi:hypothetical protein
MPRQNRPDVKKQPPTKKKKKIPKRKTKKNPQKHTSPSDANRRVMVPKRQERDRAGGLVEPLGLPRRDGRVVHGISGQKVQDHRLVQVVAVARGHFNGNLLPVARGEGALRAVGPEQADDLVRGTESGPLEGKAGHGLVLLGVGGAAGTDGVGRSNPEERKGGKKNKQMNKNPIVRKKSLVNGIFVHLHCKSSSSTS